MSPDLSSAASIISFDSFSDLDTYPCHLQVPPSASKAHDSELHGADLRAEYTSLPEGKTPSSSFERHDEYFFKDGNVTFLVGGTLYCVHRYFFSRDSIYFSSRFAKLDIRDHEALSTIISIGDVERDDFEALLAVLYPANFEAHELTYEQWKSVLHLSTRWDFTSLRKLAIKSITPPTPHDQLVLARTYAVDRWVLPALTALCKRALPLSLDEAQEMSLEDVVLVATVREEIRGGGLPSHVDAADIPRYIKVAQAGKRSRPVGPEVYWNEPKSGSTVQESDLMMADEDTKTMSTSGPQHVGTKEGEGDVEHSSKEGEAVTMFAENGAEAMVTEQILQCLEAEEAMYCADVEENANKEQEEAARAKEAKEKEAEEAKKAVEEVNANKEQEEAAPAKEVKEKEAAEAKKAVEEANAKKLEADLQAKAKADAQKRAEANEIARKKQENATRLKATADAEAKNAVETKTTKAFQRAAQAAKTAEKAARKAKKAAELANALNNK